MADRTPLNRPTVVQKPANAAETRLELIELLATTAHARLRTLAWIGIMTFSAGVLLSLTLPALLGRPGWERAVMAGLCAFLALASLGVWLFARQARPAARTVIRVGLGYVVLAAQAMAAAEVAIGPVATADYDGVPGMCIWIVLFPLIIPCLPSQALIAALLCATTLPLAYEVALSVGRPPSALPELVRWFAPGFFCAGVSWGAAWAFGRTAGELARSRREARELGSYTLVERLGQGGMGEVWRARHRLLPRDAAMKFMRPADDLRHDPDASADLARRFQREARAIALLKSPHTIQLYDFGLTPEGDLYYVMELLDGLDLDTLVQRHGPQPPARVALLLTQACLSLAEAHAQGLVHRDVKPGNLMLCRPGEANDHVKVLDFGLVGAAQAPASAASPGQTGFAGTPGFIAPELIFGGKIAEPVSDLYGLGAVGYWLLTGSTVFPAPGGGEDLVAHQMDRPLPPSQRLGHPLPDGLDDIILACLAKQPQARPASALALRQRLLPLATWSEADAAAWWAAV